tara:strand:+ start:4693 stop:4890 length:198 start_codon:yes stop_codon:yes gene_type:complete
MGLGADNILNLLVDSLSVEELEAALQRKKGNSYTLPKPMTDKERLMHEYRKRMIAMGILHPPRSI